MFRFSPGDIVLFTKFTAKVIQALQDEGGSRSEFQLAVRQCEAFLSAMQELRSLDLSSLPESFHSQITHSSSALESFINDFRKSISNYEKSLAEQSQRGVISSSPRKIQWALMATDDLGKFRQGLSAQLDHLKLMISTSVLSALISITQPQGMLGMGPGTLSSVRVPPQSTYHVNHSVNWKLSDLSERLIHQKVDVITDLVYERLLTRGGMPVEMQGRVRTLPDQPTDDHPVQAHLPINSQPQLLPTTAVHNHTLVEDIHVMEEERTAKRYDSDDTTIAEEINEYLRSLNLSELSGEERRYVERQGLTTRLFIHNNETTCSNAPDGLQNNEDGGSSRSWSHDRANNNVKNSPSLLDPLSTLSLAANILEFVTMAVGLSFKASQIYRDTKRSKELMKVSRVLKQYSTILHAAYEVILNTMPAGKLQNLGWQIIEDSERILRELGYILCQFRTPDRLTHAVKNATMWVLRKNEIRDVRNELESLQSTLSAMLQIHQIKMTHINTVNITTRTSLPCKLYVA